MNASRFRQGLSMHLAAVLAAAVLSGLMAPEAAMAEDEDMNTSAYLVFDPETGEFVTVHDPAMTGHPAATAASADAAVAPGDRAGLPMPLMTAVAAVVLAAGGAFFWLRRNRWGKR